MDEHQEFKSMQKKTRSMMCFSPSYANREDSAQTNVTQGSRTDMKMAACTRPYRSRGPRKVPALNNDKIHSFRNYSIATTEESSTNSRQCPVKKSTVGGLLSRRSP